MTFSTIRRSAPTALLLFTGISGRLYGQSSRLLYAETVRESTTIWSSGPPMGQEPQRIYQFRHPDGWDGRFSLSPNGTRIAFNRVTAATPKEVTKTGLYLLDLGTRVIRELDGDIFLYTAPIWDQNNRAITYESVATDDHGVATTTVRSIDLVTGRKSVLFADDAALILPIGVAATGQLLYYRAAQGSHSLMTYDPATQARQLAADLTADRPRDFSLSPDRTRVLFRAQGTKYGATEAVRYLDIEQRQVRTVLDEHDELPTPTWSANGLSVAIGGRLSRQGRREWPASGIPPVQPPGTPDPGEYPAPDGIELPIAQSPAGTHDFVRYHTPTRDYYGIFDRSTRTWRWLDSPGSIQWIGWTGQ